MPVSLVLETANNPGDALSIALNGPPTGSWAWLEKVPSGQRGEYYIVGSDGLREKGIGYPVADSPNRFVRETVLDGSMGPGVRVPFTGQVDCYSDFIPERTGRRGADGKTPYEDVPDALMSRLISNQAVSIPNGQQSLMSFNALGVSNLQPGLVVPTSGFTVAQAGLHRSEASVTFAANATGARTIALLLNGVVVKSKQFAAAAGIPITMEVYIQTFFALGDVLQLSIAQTSGGALNAGGNGYDDFTLTRLRG